MNVDMAFCKGETVLEMVVRDYYGRIILLTSKIVMNASPLHANTLAINWAFEVVEMGVWSNVEWNLDAQDLVDEVNSILDLRGGIQSI